MLVLIDLEMEGFGPFIERTIVSFQSNCSTLIRGQWTNKPISSGTGKSHIMKGVAFAGGYCDIPSTELKNWDSKKFSVKLRIKNTDTDELITIIRDPKLKVLVNDIPVEGTSEASEEKLRSIFKLPSELVRILTYRPQKKPGEFLNSTDAQKKEFLSTLLELNKYEEALDKAEKKSKQIENQSLLINNSIQSIQGLLPSLTTNLIAVEEATHIIEQHLKQIEKLNEDRTAKQHKAEELKTTLNNGEDPRLKGLNTQIAEYNNQKTIHNSQIANINKVINQVAAAKTNINQIQSDAQKITNEVNTLKNHGKCPTCLQDWDKHHDYIEAKKKTLTELLNKYQELNKLIQETQTQGVELPTIEGQVKMIDDLVRTTQDQISQVKAEAKMATVPLANIVQEISTIESQVRSSHSVISSQKSLIKELEEKKRLRETKEKELTELTNSKGQIEDSKSAYEVILKILGRAGFMSVIFEEVLADIESRANTMIARIPNVELLTLSIRSFATTSKGAIQKKIDIKAFKAGKEISLKNLSGGQICALELCTDLAIRECIRQRTGAPFAWLALDEAMDGLDVETKKPTLEMIQELVSGQVIVIDHATEIKENFENIITVEYDGSQSRIL